MGKLRTRPSARRVVRQIPVHSSESGKGTLRFSKSLFDNSKARLHCKSKTRPSGSDSWICRRFASLRIVTEKILIRDSEHLPVSRTRVYGCLSLGNSLSWRRACPEPTEGARLHCLRPSGRVWRVERPSLRTGQKLRTVNERGHFSVATNASALSQFLSLAEHTEITEF